ncbi:response regulator [Alteromonas antoniana]|uniref:response regulator n=1 Tax=Alteromonas antoniana TaxID=2803813 RepID=UPI001C4692EE|nr:response regulator [Alteromonas antoniana]
MTHNRDAKILIVDDEEVSVMTLRQAVKNLGRIESSSSSSDAIKKAREFKPDLILMDLNLDSMNGFEVSDEIRKYLPEVGVVFITSEDNATAASGDGHIESDAYARGGMDFITKPIDLHLCYNMVSNHLEIALSKSELSIKNTQMSTMLNAIGEAVFLTDKSGNILLSNAVAKKLVGYTALEFDKKPISEFIELLDGNGNLVESQVEKALSDLKDISAPIAYTLLNREGLEQKVISGVKVIYSKNGDVAGTVHILKPVSSVSLYDKETTLPSADLLQDRLQHAMSMALNGSKLGDTVIVTAIKVTNGNLLTDTHGPGVMADCVTEFSKSIKRCLAPEDSFGRLDDTTFLIISMCNGNAGSIEDFQQRVSAASNEKIYHMGEDMTLNVNIGSATFPEDGATPSALVEKALEHADRH